MEAIFPSSPFIDEKPPLLQPLPHTAYGSVSKHYQNRVLASLAALMTHFCLTQSEEAMVKDSCTRTIGAHLLSGIQGNYLVNLFNGYKPNLPNMRDQSTMKAYHLMALGLALQSEGIYGAALDSFSKANAIICSRPARDLTCSPSKDDVQIDRCLARMSKAVTEIEKRIFTQRQKVNRLHPVDDNPSPAKQLVRPPDYMEESTEE